MILAKSDFREIEMNLNWLATLYYPSGGSIFIDTINDAHHFFRTKHVTDSVEIVLVNHMHDCADDLLSYIKSRNLNKNFSIIIATEDSDDGASLCIQHNAQAFVSCASAQKDLKLLFGDSYLF